MTPLLQCCAICTPFSQLSQHSVAASASHCSRRYARALWQCGSPLHCVHEKLGTVQLGPGYVLGGVCGCISALHPLTCFCSFSNLATIAIRTLQYVYTVNGTLYTMQPHCIECFATCNCVYTMPCEPMQLFRAN